LHYTLLETQWILTVIVQVLPREAHAVSAQMAEQEEKKKVCVIGAGAAGLCAARHLAANAKFEVTVYEQTREIGGTWVYKEQVGLDENGLPIHSSMYQNLRFEIRSSVAIVW